MLHVFAFLCSTDEQIESFHERASFSAMVETDLFLEGNAYQVLGEAYCKINKFHEALSSYEIAARLYANADSFGNAEYCADEANLIACDLWLDESGAKIRQETASLKQESNDGVTGYELSFGEDSFLRRGARSINCQAFGAYSETIDRNNFVYSR